MHESAAPGTTTRGSVAPQGGPTVTSPTSEINTKRRALALSVLLAALYASLPGGSQSLSGQAIIAFVTAAFALAALLVMAFRRPSGMDQLGA